MAHHRVDAYLGIGFQTATHRLAAGGKLWHWSADPFRQGASLGVAISCVLSLFILAQANGSPVWLGTVNLLFGTRS